jgi:hypothetical protein
LAFAFSLRICACSGVPPGSWAFGVGHPIKTLPSVWGSEARSAEIDRPAGVTRTVQVRLNKVEPSESVNGRNLLAKANDRSSCFDESKEFWPKMPFVVERFAFTGRAEWLAGAASGPDFSVVCPPSEPERVRPDSNAGEEMALRVSGEFVGSNIGN